MFTCWVSLFCNGFTLGPTAHATLVGIDKTKKMTCKIAPNLNYNFFWGHILNAMKIISYVAKHIWNIKMHTNVKWKKNTKHLILKKYMWFKLQSSHNQS
jgi:hypothetical protein